MRKLMTFAAATLLMCGAAHAVPASPRAHTITMADGTTLQVRQLGDEFNHSLATADGFMIGQGTDGYYYYRSVGALTDVRAHDAAARSASEKIFVEKNRENLSLNTLVQQRLREGTARSRYAAPPKREGETQVPTMGSPRVPIILVQYTDKSMRHTKAQFEAHYKTDPKSAYQYFVDQSIGQYTPQFDIFGIYNLPSTRATYGANLSNGDDRGVAQMVCDAIDAAGNDIDWSPYDNDGDGEADVCIVVYAGVGESQSWVTNAVWPCQWDLATAAYYNDGSGPKVRNGVTINRFAVFNELAGSNDNGSTLDGIGTFCHEFSHCLGLPDFYETTYRNGYFGMDVWSILDSGCYNGGSVDGDTPIGYSAYEKSFMGWVEPIEPTDNTKYTLPVWGKNGTDNVALKITALNDNEFFMLENRRKQGWDLYIPDQGVLITHFTYVPSRWEANTVNNQSMQLATVIPADNSLTTWTLSNDCYGRSNHAFTATSSPAMKANMSANGTLASSTGGAGAIDKPVTDITINSDGTASLWYRYGYVTHEAPELTDVTDVTTTGFTAHWTPGQGVADYSLSLSDLDATYGDVEEILAETFPSDVFNKEGSQDVGTTLDDMMDNTGWTGEGLFKHIGGIRMGSGSKYGRLTSPALDLGDSNSVTVKFDVYPYNQDADVKLGVAYGDQIRYVELPAGVDGTYTLVFNNVSSGASVEFTTTELRKRAVIHGITIYSGAMADDQGTVIDGITDTEYAFTGLESGHLYRLKLRARFTDDTWSNWTAPVDVQLIKGGYLPGDVDGNGVVDVEDLNILINIILELDSADNYGGRAYITGGSSVGITDVNELVNILIAQ